MTGDITKHQVGGNHYLKMKIQPWDIIDAIGLDFYEGTAVTYILRWKLKGGIEDLRKAIHTIERRIAIEGDVDETSTNQETGQHMVQVNQAAIRE